VSGLSKHLFAGSGLPGLAVEQGDRLLCRRDTGSGSGLRCHALSTTRSWRGPSKLSSGTDGVRRDASLTTSLTLAITALPRSAHTTAAPTLSCVSAPGTNPVRTFAHVRLRKPLFRLQPKSVVGFRLPPDPGSQDRELAALLFLLEDRVWPTACWFVYFGLGVQAP
jgi:hypothetical protein